MTTRRSFLGQTAGAALALAAPARIGLAAEVIRLKVHHFLPPQATLSALIIEPWAKAIEEAAGGRLKIDRFYSMALGGKAPDLMDQAADGIADIVLTLPGYTPGRFPRTEAFELPFMMTNARATSAALWDYGQAELVDNDFKDFKVLGLWVHGPGVIHSRRPVTRLEDLAGLKLRAPTRVTNKLFARLGATPVGMPVPAVPEALAKGVIDATALPWEVTLALKVPELVHHHTEFTGNALYTATFVMAMNKQVWAGLPKDLQEVIDAHSGAAFSARSGATMQEMDAPARQYAEEIGNEIITLEGEAVRPWREAAAPVIDDWIVEMREQGIDGGALVEAARALIARHSA